MEFNFLKNTPLEQALEKFLLELKSCGLCRKSEKISVVNALNRITSKAVYAKFCSPHYNASAMDGIALMAEKTYGATESCPIRVEKYEVIWVDTGDPIPEGCDCVIMVEDVIEENEQILLYHPATPWQHIRQIGEDMSIGDMVLSSFEKITPVAMGAMLACGVIEVEVLKRPIVGIIPTGDEIVEHTNKPQKGEIIEFNSTIFSNMALECGALSKVYPIVKDIRKALEINLMKATKECDIVLLNAGSSAGKDDYSFEIIDQIGKVILHGIAIKPGKPTILGTIGAVPVIGLPGYPGSGIIVFNNVVEPVINYLSGMKTKKGEFCNAVATRNYNSSLNYKEFVKLRLGYINGQIVATPINHGAGVVSSFLKADAIFEISRNSEGINQGEEINVKLLREKKEIFGKLVISGSHDPLIDEIMDIMVRQENEHGVVSVHVGSMGAIFAIKRKEAHLGAIHLLDENTGIYNIAYIERYFSDGEVIIIKGVRRMQGLMVKKNNPKRIGGMSDLQRNDVSFVNRQKGSGTRILTDYQIKKGGLSKEKIEGYEREEFTHTNVAAIVAAGSADVGMGIYSVAAMYDLDFIPICEEHYDFLVDKSTVKLNSYKEFIDVIKGEIFRERLNKMGGYRLEQIGEVLWER